MKSRRLSIACPIDAPNPVYKAVFTRQPFRLADLAELVYLPQGTASPIEDGAGQEKNASKAFGPLHPARRAMEAAGRDQAVSSSRCREGMAEYRRRSDGMRGIQIPSAAVEIGSEFAGAHADEMPRHVSRWTPS